MLHIGEGSTIGNIKMINGNIRNNIQSASKGRLSTQQNSKYTDIIGKLPSALSSEHGYHVSCYSNFTAISKNDSSPDEN